MQQQAAVHLGIAESPYKLTMAARTGIVLHSLSPQGWGGGEGVGRTSLALCCMRHACSMPPDILHSPNICNADLNGINEHLSIRLNTTLC